MNGQPINCVRMQAVVIGRVQGVGYRAWVQRIAGGLGLTGVAANRWDGAVVVEVQGNPDAVERFLHILNIGPSAAHVKEVRNNLISIVPDENGFAIL